MENKSRFRLGEVQGKRLARKIVTLPTLPTVAAKMMQIIDHPETSARDLSAVIRSDHVIASRLLKLANSAYYGLRRQVANLDMAVVLLGFENIRNLTLSLSVIESFSRNWRGHFDYSEFWEHAYACGVAAQMFVSEIQPGKAADAFAAGLIHDVGKLILSQFAPDHFEAVIAHIEQHPSCDFDHAEREVLGISHAQLGGWLAEKWNFPVSLAQAIALHHTPEEGRDASLLPWAVHTADYLVHQLGIGFDAGVAMPTLNQNVAEMLCLPLTDSGLPDFEPYAGRLFQLLAQADSFFHFLHKEEIQC